MSFRIYRAFFVLVVGLSASFASARDAYVLLSGGGTPLTNNYSQYLQAKGVAQHLQSTYPKDSVWVFFGEGNRPGQPVTLADVRKQVKERGMIRESWLPGVLPENRPARKAVFLQAMREEILPAVADGGTLYLFVGDHGSLAKKEPRESVVTMWQMVNSDGKGGWRTNIEEELSVTDLREALADGLGQGKVVFCMTQCYSGGFHYVGVPRAVLPSTDWFSAVPDWAIPLDEKPLPLAAGFTAVDEDSLAAGCDPDPDPDRWAGYERFVPEALLGVDLFSGKKTGAGLASYAAAHEAAVLVDQTIDKPRSSSEQFLERWAVVVEKLAGEANLRSDVRMQVEAYLRAVDNGSADARDVHFEAKRARFGEYLRSMIDQLPSGTELLVSGSREDLERAIGPKPTPRGSSGPMLANRGHGEPNERMKLWTETVRPAWKAAVEAGKVKKLRGPALGFEKALLAQEEKGRNLMFAPGWQNPILNDLYWASGYAFPGTLDKKKAVAVTRWGAERRRAIFEWAMKSKDSTVIAAAQTLWPMFKEGKKATVAIAPAPRGLSQKIAAERTLFYRRVLGAWAFLVAMQEESALAQLHALIELETTPLPT